MKKRYVIMMAVVLVSLWAAAAQANLLVNGSFDIATNFVDNTGQDTMKLAVTSTTMTGWTVISADLAWIGPSNPFGLTGSNGSGYFLDLTGYHDSSPYGGVEQTINTVFGQQYKLEFDLGSSTTYGLPSAITATASAGPTSLTFTSVNTSSSNAWEHYILPFTASATTTIISLTGSQAGSNDKGNYIGLDNVSVSSIPLPPTALLLGSGLAGLGLLRRKWSLKK